MSSATDSASQSNTVEMYGTHDGSFFNDDAKSYSTYEKGLDEDYAKHYDDDDDDVIDQVKKGSKGTYLTDEPSPIRQSPPWSKMEGLCLSLSNLVFHSMIKPVDISRC